MYIIYIMEKNDQKIKPIKSLEELTEVKKGHPIQISDNLPKDKNLEAKNKGFEPSKSYFVVEPEVRYNLGPMTPGEIDYDIEPTQEIPYLTGNLIIENYRGEKLKSHYKHFYRVFSE